MAVIHALMDTFFTRLQTSKVALPSKLPWPDPPGQSRPFDVPLECAGELHIQRFLAFRGVPVPEDAGARREAAAREAICYMAELWEKKQFAWCHDHYVLRKSGLTFPYRAEFMNVWGFWSEISPWMRSIACGQVTFALEHFVVGGLVPLLYIWTKDDRFFYGAIYTDLAFEMFDLLAIFWRRLTGMDRTISRFHPAVDVTLVPHHIFTVGLELVGLMSGHAVSKLFILHIFVTSHLTGGLMYAGIALHQSPLIAQRRLVYAFQVFSYVAIIICRVFWWAPIAAGCLRAAYLYAGGFPAHLGKEHAGLAYTYPAASPIFLTLLALCAFYTYFNLDMVSFNWKILKKAAARLEETCPQKVAPERVAHTRKVM